MVMEMAGHGDLLEYVRLRGALGEDKAKFMFFQLVSAVEYMHSFNVVHRYRPTASLSSVANYVTGIIVQQSPGGRPSHSSRYNMSQKRAKFGQAVVSASTNKL